MVSGYRRELALRRAWQTYARQALIERFIGDLRDELLNETLFTTLVEAKAHTAAWEEDNNRNSSHSSLGNLTPVKLATKMAPENPTA